MNPQSLAIVAAFLVAFAGVAGLFRAGRFEAAGKLDQARWVARRSGFVAAVGSVAVAMLVYMRPMPASPRLGIIALVLACGITSVLAGLAGKPRPSAGVAMLFLSASAALVTLRMWPR